MTQKLDYSREEAMQILNSESYSDEDKRKIYEQYMSQLKKNRKNAIVTKLNEYAKDIPVITKEIYISKLKEYETDDLSKPFEVIEKELSDFETDMKNKYNLYIQKQREQEAQILAASVEPEPVEETSEESFDDTIFSEPIGDIMTEEEEDDEEEVKPSLLITDQISVINEQTNTDLKPLFDTSDADSKEIMPDDINDNEKGNASAIILSIIAVIIGFAVMYSIIKLN